MKRGDLIFLLVALLVIGILIFGVLKHYRRAAQFRIHYENMLIAEQLATRTNSDLVELPASLSNQLARFLASPGHAQGMEFGDEPPPIGDGSATTRIFLTNTIGETLGIRLRRDGPYSSYRTLSLWQPPARKN